MKLIGILGGIGSGKTTVAELFVRHGCAVIHADRIVHELLEQPDIRSRIVSEFGQDILDGQGRIQRSRLADKAFASAETVQRINGILHPPVLARTEELIAEYGRNAAVPAIVLDVPLLVETGWHKRCDVLVFVDLDESERARRAESRGLSFENQVKKREKFQISLDTKKNIAHYTVDNNSGFSATADQVDRIFSAIC